MKGGHREVTGGVSGPLGPTCLPVCMSQSCRQNTNINGVRFLITNSDGQYYCILNDLIMILCILSV